MISAWRPEIQDDKTKAALEQNFLLTLSLIKKTILIKM